MNDGKAGKGSSDTLRMVAYNAGQGGPRDPAAWARIVEALAPDLFLSLIHI